MEVQSDPYIVENRLTELSLPKPEILRRAVEVALFERHSCTKLDPKSTPGYEAWRWATRILREHLIPQGWRPKDLKNLPLVVNPMNGLAIAVTSGNENTGNPYRQPTSKYPKGLVTSTCIQRNRRLQLLLFGQRESRTVVATPPHEMWATWLLVMAFPTVDGTHASCEISLPTACNEAGYVVEWSERLILDVVNLDTEATPERRGRKDAGGVEVNISRRGA